MNYRHAFHAGNFADLVKHAALTLCLEALSKGEGPLLAIDTHAGAGIYDLGGREALRSGEARDGVVKLLADAAAPEGFDSLVAAVRRLNGEGAPRLYPGSPALIAAALRPGDRLIACELRGEEYGQLADFLAPLDGVEVLKADGFAFAPSRVIGEGAVLVHIDPPYERGEDYARAVEAAAAVLAKAPRAAIMIWLPLKDLETFDRFLRRLEGAVAQPVLIAETRLGSLDDPMRMNGCALAIINPPAGLAADLEPVCRWTAQAAGGGAAQGRVWEL